MKAFLCELILTCSVIAPGAKPVDELTYGNILYSYYQEDYQQALLDTLVAESQDRRGEDTVRFDLAKGSFAFADGMYGYANEIFASVESSELTELEHVRLAFHTAREYHRRQEWAGLEEQLTKIDLGKSWRGKAKFHPEVEYMRAEVAMHKGELEAAQQLLYQLAVEDPLRAYGLFNLGVAYKNQSLNEQAAAVFSELAGLDAYSDEAFDLISRAKLALAFVSTQLNETKDAAEVLGALPGTGRYRDVALASYGNLAMEQEDYKLAARIWMTLQDTEYWTSSTATARLGFPMSLENLASQETALVQYRNAEQSFESRLTALQVLSKEAENSEWVRSLLLAFSEPVADEHAMSELMQSWRDELGHTDWLEWLSTEAVHKVLVQWRSLVDMQDWIERLPNHLAALQEVGNEQRRRASAANSLLNDQALLDNRAEHQNRLATIEQQVEVVQGSDLDFSSEWMYQLASPEERENLADLDAMLTKIETHMSVKDQDKWRTRIMRLRGVLFYRIAAEQSIRGRGLANSLGETQQVLGELNDKITRIQEAEGQLVAGVETDFTVFQDRAEDVEVLVGEALSGREQLLAMQLRRGMQQEMREVEQYLLATRIAIARATDQLALGADISPETKR